MIGSSSIDFQRVIVQGTKFYKSLEIHYDLGNLTIYRSAFAYQMAELLPDNCGRIEARHAAPDRIVLELVDLNQSAEIIVKEAYFPGWFATMEGAPLNVDRSNTPPYVGYITLSVPAGEHRIELVYKSESGTWMHVSAVTFTVLIAIALLGEWRVRSHISRKAETQ